MATLASGDRGALEALYLRHAPGLASRLRRRCADPGLIDQAIQDTFLAVWRKPGSYDGRGAVGAWVWGIASRRLMDELRRHRPVVGVAARDEVIGSAEDEVLVGIEHGDLGAALVRLSPDLRAVVQATVLDGLTTSEASRHLGIPAGTVKTRMMRARAVLREAALHPTSPIDEPRRRPTVSLG